MNILFQFLLAFSLTVLIEFVVVLVFLKKPFDSLKTSFVLNSLTHPIFWFLMKFAFSYNFWMFLFLELIVFLIEGVLLLKVFKFDLKKAFVFSFVMNFISALFGVIL